METKMGTGDGASRKDITSEFMNCVKQLKLGELLKCDHFTLLEAMSAIELMDPKMDSGMLLKRSNRKIFTFEQSIKNRIVKIRNLSFNELIGIMDDTYSCLSSWMDGHHLAQTVMTNLYLHDPERIEDRCLRVFSLAILKIVDSIDRLVQLVYCIEEEDFHLNVGKFYLAAHMNEQKVLNSLEDLCQHYEKLLNDCQSTSSSMLPTSSQNHNNNNNNNNIKKQQELDKQQQFPRLESNVEYDKTQLSALICRLRFTYYFFSCFLNIVRNLLKNHWETGQLTEVQLQKISKLVHSSAFNCDQQLEKCYHHLDKWRDTIELGIKPVKQSESETLSEGDYPTIMGFEPLVNLRLLPPAYPRCPSIRSRSDTVDYLEALIIRLRECISISNSFTNKSFIKSLELIENFSKYFRPQSCVISRSLIQTLYQPNRSLKLLKDELLKSLSEFCEPLVQDMKKDEAKSNALNEFFCECAKSFSLAVSIYGHNTARQHEKFPDLITSFKNLQYSALLINSVFNNIIIYSWTTCHLARLCIKYIISSLELELFSAHEYPYVFWYLYDILYRNEKEQLEIARQFIYDSQLVTDDKRNKGKKQRRRNQQCASYHDKSLLCNEAFRFLTGGTFLLTYGLKLQGKIKTPLVTCTDINSIEVVDKEVGADMLKSSSSQTVADFTSEEICFAHRFGFLTGTSVYQSYKQTLGRLEKVEFIYREALECFSEAKERFQLLGAKYENCLKVCKTNLVVIKILSSNLNSFSDREIEFSFDTHPSFPTLKV